MRINVLAFALTAGLFAGVGLFFVTWWIILFEGATYDHMLIGLVYRGYSISPLGSLIGLIWAFGDFFIGGAIFAWLYNFLSKGKAQSA